MKRLLTKAEVILFCILYFFIGPSFGQSDPSFPIMPAQIGGAGGPFKFGTSEGVRWIAWTHTRGTRLAVVCAATDYEVIEPATIGLTTPISTARAFWYANVFADCRTDDYLRPGYRAARAAFNLP